MKFLVMLACLVLAACGERPPPSPMDPEDAIVLSRMMSRPATVQATPSPMFIGTQRGTVMCQNAWGVVLCN